MSEGDGIAWIGPETNGAVGVGNHACPIMAAECGSEDCRFRPIKCWVRHPSDGEPGASCYRYRCDTCGGLWYVAFPMLDCVFDRAGRIVAIPEPEVRRTNGGPE